LTGCSCVAEEQIMPVVDCNNHVKSASHFFGPSCAVNSLTDIYNPLGDNSGDLCELCASKVVGEHCTAHDPYAGYQVDLFFNFLSFLHLDQFLFSSFHLFLSK